VKYKWLTIKKILSLLKIQFVIEKILQFLQQIFFTGTLVFVNTGSPL